MEEKKKKSRSSELYVTSAVSVPKEEVKDYKGLTVEENTQYLEYILEKLEKGKDDIFKKKPILKGIINFKVYKSHEETFKKVQDKLKENNISLSSIFRYYFNDFIKHSLKNGK